MWHRSNDGHGTFRYPASLWRKASSLERARRVRTFKICQDKAMLNLVVTLLIIALIAAVLGFGGIAVAAVGIAKIVFFVALLLFLIALLAGTMRGPRTL
jgi:uncharacterized membrane protein YtjA (UPF0391 family)